MKVKATRLKLIKLPSLGMRTKEAQNKKKVTRTTLTVPRRNQTRTNSSGNKLIMSELQLHLILLLVNTSL